MKNLLCGLGFHNWEHVGYDVWAERWDGDSNDSIYYSSHRKCNNCEKRINSYKKQGIPPEIQINDEMTSFVDHSTAFMDPKPLNFRE